MYQKPVLVQAAYFGVKESWRDGSFYQNGNIPGESESEDSWDLHELSTFDQARTVNAYMQAISDRPWVIGYVHFGYWQWEMPLLPDWSVRG